MGSGMLKRDRKRERFRKIVGVMGRATIEGERAAAREAAVRMAAIHGMTLEEAVEESHPERDDGRMSAAERKARRDDVDAWAAAATRTTGILYTSDAAAVEARLHL